MIKPIETEYKGYKFRARLEARWAVFFDACGVKWEYEPEGFDLGDGLYYLPDFLLHDVIYRLNQVDEPIDLWVEVKGLMKKKDHQKIRTFSKDNKIIMVPNIPDGENFDAIVDNIQQNHDDNCCFFSFDYIDGDCYTAFPVIVGESISKKLALVGGDYLWSINEEETANAYKKARQARFEYGEHGGLFHADQQHYSKRDLSYNRYFYYHTACYSHMS